MWINASAQLDRFLGPLFLTTPYFYFKRINFYFINGNTQIMRTFPGEKIQNDKYMLAQSNTPYGKITKVSISYFI